MARGTGVVICAVIGMVMILAAGTYAARIVSITTCTSITEPGTIPVGITDTFSPQSPEICAVVVLDDVIPGTVLNGTWVAVDAIETPNYIIDSAIVPVKDGGQIRARFGISRPNAGWPTGQYRLDFYIDGTLATSAPFTIADNAGTPPPPSGRSTSSPAPAAAPSSGGLSGTYTYDDEGATMTLVLQGGSDGQVGGTLSSPDGWQMKVEGMMQDEAAVGSCYNDQGGYYFEAYPEKGGLTMNLIEPGADGSPDYTKAHQLLFSRKGGAPAVAVPSLGRPAGDSRPSPVMPTAPVGVSTEGYGDPAWGFAVHPPAGWKAQKTAQGVVMGHDAIAGMIIVFPHMMNDLQTVQAQMQSGLNEEGTQLNLSGGLQQLGANAVAGEYAGIFNGQQARARGIGTLSPYGGGAYILGVTAPDKYTGEIARAADAVAAGMEYARAQTSDLMQAFAGTWVTMTRNTETRVTLAPDGGYYENYEASYSGSSSDQYGNQDMAWGQAGQSQSQGRWSVQGSREQGVLTITYANGSTTTIEYRVHVENGQTYWNEYWFNGELYGRQ